MQQNLLPMILCGVRKCARQNTFWGCKEVLWNLLWDEICFIVALFCVDLEETALLNMKTACPQPHNYFILWCNEEKRMAVLSRKLKYGLGRVIKRKEDILPEYDSACAVCSSIALNVVLHFCSSSCPRLTIPHLEAPSPPQAGLLLKQTSPHDLSTLPLFLLLTAKSFFREAVRCPAAHGLLTKMCLPFVPWSFPFPKPVCKTTIWSQTYSMAIHWPLSTNYAKSSMCFLCTNSNRERESPSSRILPSIDFGQVHSDHLYVGHVFKYYLLMSFSLTKGRSWTCFQGNELVKPT